MIADLGSFEIVSYAAFEEAARSEATDRDRFREPEEGFRGWGNLGHYPHWLGDEDRGEDHRLYLRVLGQPAPESPSRPNQGVVGMNLTTHI
jgi:hypothetical protein